MIVRSSDVACYQQISDILGDRIAKGDYAVGDQLPSEAEISETYGVNRHTAREAIRQLKDEGLVYSVRGKGTFVARTKLVYRISRKVQFSQQILEIGQMPGTQLLESLIQPATERIARHLQMAQGAPVLTLHMVRLVNQVPFSLTTSHLPARRFEGLEERLHRNFSLYQLLKTHFEVNARRRESVFEVAMPETWELQHLHLAATDPLLLVRSIACDDQGVPVEYAISRMRGDMGRIAIRFDDELFSD